MGSGKETVLLLPPYLCCWGRVCSPLAPTFKLTFGQLSSRALSRSFRACVPPNTSLLLSVPSSPIPRRIRTPHALHAFTAPVFSMRPPKVPALSFPSQFLQWPWPPVCLKVWVTLAHRRVIQNVSSSCSTGAPQPTFSPDLSRLFRRGPPLGPSPLNVWPPAPDCSPAVMNVTAILLGQTSS